MDKRRRRRRAVGAAITGVVVAAAAMGPTTVAQAQDPPIKAEWLANTLSRAMKPGEVKNNVVSGAMARRDRAVADWKGAMARYQQARQRAAKVKNRAKRKTAFRSADAKAPDPRAKPEYNVVWSAKQNAGDVHAKVVSELLTNMTVNPQGLLDMLGPQFMPGLDGFQVIDVRRQSVDGSRNPDYGRVVNFVQLPLPWGVETEAHHMQYDWYDGDPIIAGALFNSATFVLDPKNIPSLRLANTYSPLDTASGSIPDAYERVGDGRFVGTYMGGPIYNFGGSPGSVIVFKPDRQKGLVIESQTPAGGMMGRNAGGVPEACSSVEARPLGTCANPHGIQVRQDLGRMVTNDYAEPREIVLDPVKVLQKETFRPTVRTWDTSNPAKPKLIATAHMPKTWRKPANRSHQNIGIMEGAKTWGPGTAPNMLPSKGFFASAMCGGGILFNPDVTKDRGDASGNWIQVWEDGISQLRTQKQDIEGRIGEFQDEPGGCAGGTWLQTSPNNRWLTRAVQGRAPGGDNYFDQGAQKLIYNLDIQPLLESAKDGKVACDLSKGIDIDGNGTRDISGAEAVGRLAQGEKIADCPRPLDELVVQDRTSGGPHWASLDNHSLTADGYPTRLTFSNYFVSRTGIDGDHRFYVVDMARDGKLSYDKGFRDENTAAMGVNFNRRDWPGSPDAGFYKPHSMIWVCPPGVCTSASNTLDPARAKAKMAAMKAAAKAKKAKKAKAKGRAKGKTRK